MIDDTAGTIQVNIGAPSARGRTRKQHVSDVTSRSATVGPVILWAHHLESQPLSHRPEIKSSSHSYGSICANCAADNGWSDRTSMDIRLFIGTGIAGRVQTEQTSQIDAKNPLGNCSVPSDTSGVATERNPNGTGKRESRANFFSGDGYDRFCTDCRNLRSDFHPGDTPV